MPTNRGHRPCTHVYATRRPALRPQRHRHRCLSMSLNVARCLLHSRDGAVQSAAGWLPAPKLRGEEEERGKKKSEGRRSSRRRAKGESSWAERGAMERWSDGTWQDSTSSSDAVGHVMPDTMTSTTTTSDTRRHDDRARRRRARPHLDDAVVRGGGQQVALRVPRDHVDGLPLRAAGRGVREM